MISDTHDKVSAIKEFLKTMLSDPEAVYLIHLGDIVSPFSMKLIVEELPQDFGLKVVLGNNDGDKILLMSTCRDVVEQPEEMEICGLKALLFHGFKSPELTERIVCGIACGGYYDIVLYGHTHRFKLDSVCSSYVVNPGTLSGYLSTVSTYAVVDCEKLTASIIELETGKELAALTLSASGRRRITGISRNQR